LDDSADAADPLDYGQSPPGRLEHGTGDATAAAALAAVGFDPGAAEMLIARDPRGTHRGHARRDRRDRRGRRLGDPSRRRRALTQRPTRRFRELAAGKQYLVEALELAGQGKVKTLTEVFPKEQIAEAYQKVADGDVRFRAVVTY
jgi:hypothetical protein